MPEEVNAESNDLSAEAAAILEGERLAGVEAARAELTAAASRMPAPQFCDADGKRDAEGNPVGCGALLPDGVYSDSWLEQADENAPIVRVHGRFVPGGHACERCGTTYHPNVGERMKAAYAA